MQYMKFLRPYLQKLTQNFNNISSILKNPKNFQKPQILGFKTWNACTWRRLEAYQVKENLKKAWESQGKRFGVSESGLGDEKSEKNEREIDRSELWIAEVYLKTINNSRQMRCRGGVEPFVEQESRKSNIDRSSVEKLSRKKNTRGKKRCLIDPPCVEELSSGQKLSRSIHQVSRCYRDCDKKKLRKLNR